MFIDQKVADLSLVVALNGCKYFSNFKKLETCCSGCLAGFGADKQWASSSETLRPVELLVNCCSFKDWTKPVLNLCTGVYSNSQLGTFFLFREPHLRSALML